MAYHCARLGAAEVDVHGLASPDEGLGRRHGAFGALAPDLHNKRPVLLAACEERVVPRAALREGARRHHRRVANVDATPPRQHPESQLTLAHHRRANEPRRPEDAVVELPRPRGVSVGVDRDAVKVGERRGEEWVGGRRRRCRCVERGGHGSRWW